MVYYVRFMGKEDVPQVNVIDREAFPTQWPPPDYRRELQNPLARLIVACTDRQIAAEPAAPAPQEEDVSGLTARLKRWWQQNRFPGKRPNQSSGQCIMGFASMWVMADEAHITNIAVRKHYQQQGIGELLLISTLDLAIELKVNIATLEVRVSNLAAQALYSKYGFAQVGRRPGYYTDNREDAILMSTGNVTSATFQAQFQALKQAHAQKHGAKMKRLNRALSA